MAVNHPVRTTCYQKDGCKWGTWLGIALIVTGAILLMLCVPCWAYLAIIGTVLIIIGIVLLRK